MATTMIPNAGPAIDDFPPYGRVRDVARFTDLSEATIWRAVWSGDLPSTRISEKTVRISREQLRSWLESKAPPVA